MLEIGSPEPKSIASGRHPQGRGHHVFSAELQRAISEGRPDPICGEATMWRQARRQRRAAKQSKPKARRQGIRQRTTWEDEVARRLESRYGF